MCDFRYSPRLVPSASNTTTLLKCACPSFSKKLMGSTTCSCCASWANSSKNGCPSTGCASWNRSGCWVCGKYGLAKSSCRSTTCAPLRAAFSTIPLARSTFLLWHSFDTPPWHRNCVAATHTSLFIVRVNRLLVDCPWSASLFFFPARSSRDPRLGYVPSVHLFGFDPSTSPFPLRSNLLFEPGQEPHLPPFETTEPHPSGFERAAIPFGMGGSTSDRLEGRPGLSPVSNIHDDQWRAPPTWL
mmetsp:Transcript_11175/g.68902  ORF Transcript_11175/g.68902 Transcript_11175/m.68902 type:complete len:243 (+) Transcript_11175:2060-2788(+)